MTLDEIMEQLNSDDPFLQSIARWKLGKDTDYQQLMTLLDHQDAEVQLQGLLILQKHPQQVEIQRLSDLLGHRDLRLRQAALFYIGTRQVEEAMPTLIAALKSGSITPELFDGFLAAVQHLQPEFVQGYQQRIENKSNSLERVLPENFIAEIIADRQTEEPIRALALPYLDKPQEHQKLLLNQLQESKDEAYQVSLIDALSYISNDADIQLFNNLLLNILMNENNPIRVRSIAAAAMVQPNPDQCTNMLQTLSTADIDLQYAIVNKLCTCGDEAVKEWITANNSSIGAAAMSSWEKCLSGRVIEISNQEFANSVNHTGSALRGELVFKSSSSLCQSCHQVEGWGGEFGPDLTKIGSSKNQQQLIDAILYPSKEMAPEWQGWYVIDQEGNRHIGRQIDVHLKNVELMNIHGEFDSYHRPKSYGVAKKSVMPEGLQNTMTKTEFNDLIAYLTSLK
jgi:putative heme-binding domain-containing protein